MALFFRCLKLVEQYPNDSHVLYRHPELVGFDSLWRTVTNVTHTIPFVPNKVYVLIIIKLLGWIKV